MPRRRCGNLEGFDYASSGYLRLSTESSNPYVEFADGSFIGDYSQVAMTPSTAYGAWTDFRGNPGTTPANQDVLVQSFTP